MAIRDMSEAEVDEVHAVEASLKLTIELKFAEACEGLSKDQRQLLADLLSDNVRFWP